MNPEHALELCMWSLTFSLLVMPSLKFGSIEDVQFKAFAEPKSLIRREPVFGKQKQLSKVEEWFAHCQSCYQKRFQNNSKANLKPILFLVGPPGAGKTFCLERAAALHNILVHEIDTYEKPTSFIQDSITRGAKNREKCVVIKLEEIGLTWSAEVIKMILEMVATVGTTIVPMVFELSNEEAFRKQTVNNKEESLYRLFSKQKYCEWVTFYPNSPWASIQFCQHYFKSSRSERIVASAHGDFRQLRIQMEWFDLLKKEKKEWTTNKEKETFYSDIEVCEWMMKQQEPLNDIGILTDFMEIGKLLEFGRNALLFLNGVKPFKPPYKPVAKNICDASNTHLFQLLLQERRKALFKQMEEDECPPHEIMRAQETAELAGMMHMSSTGLWNSLIHCIVTKEEKEKTTVKEAISIRKCDLGTINLFSDWSDVMTDFDLNPYFIEEEYTETKAMACVSLLDPSLFRKRTVAYKDMLSFLQPLSIYSTKGSSVFVPEEQKTKTKKRKR